MNFPKFVSLRSQLLFWLCFNRACTLRRKQKRRMKRQQEQKRTEWKKRCCEENTLFGLFFGAIRTVLCQNELCEQSVRQETAYTSCASLFFPFFPSLFARGILMILESRDVSSRQVLLLWSPDTNWITAANRSQHLHGASHKSGESAWERGEKDECHGGLGDVRMENQKKKKKKSVQLKFTAVCWCSTDCDRCKYATISPFLIQQNAPENLFRFL